MSKKIQLQRPYYLFCENASGTFYVHTPEEARQGIIKKVVFTNHNYAATKEEFDILSKLPSYGNQFFRVVKPVSLSDARKANLMSGAERAQVGFYNNELQQAITLNPGDALLTNMVGMEDSDTDKFMLLNYARTQRKIDSPIVVEVMKPERKRRGRGKQPPVALVNTLEPADEVLES